MMRTMGVEKGDRVAILSQNCHRVLEAFFGTPLLGSILMPFNFRLVPEDFDYILNHGGAKVLVVEDGLTHLIEPIGIGSKRSNTSWSLATRPRLQLTNGSIMKL